jgi:hypothetical protein
VAVTPVETIEALRSAGFTFDVQDGTLILDGHGLKPSDDLRKAVAQHHKHIVAMLLTPKATPEPPGGRLQWQAFDHACSTGCQRAHTRCRACAEPLPTVWLHWPWLHPNCRLEQVECEP